MLIVTIVKYYFLVLVGGFLLWWSFLGVVGLVSFVRWSLPKADPYDIVILLILILGVARWFDWSVVYFALLALVAFFFLVRTGREELDDWLLYREPTPPRAAVQRQPGALSLAGPEAARGALSLDEDTGAVSLEDSAPT